MDEENIILVAGNPDMYPVEYYDTKTETYQGIIPNLLREFFEQSRYSLQYIYESSEDRREELYKHNQIDFISCYTNQESFAGDHRNAITVFQEERAGEIQIYQIVFSESAPESLKADMRKFFSEITQEKLTGELMEVVETKPNSAGLNYFIAGMGALIFILVVVCIRQILKNRKLLKELNRENETDEITGLGNINYITRYYGQFVNDKNRILYAMFYFRLDISEIRRIAGNEETDAFLRYMAIILGEFVGNLDICARISASGFVVLKMVNGVQQASEWAGLVVRKIREYPKQGVGYRINAAAGIYFLKQQDKDINQMIFLAEQSAREALKKGEEIRIFSEKMQKDLDEEKLLKTDIERAFSNMEFVTNLQFYVDAYNYEILGAEALTRWNHPRKGMLSPARFVPMMEKTDMISKLDFYMLKSASDFLEKLSKQGINNFFVSCNFSRKSLSSEKFIEQCSKLLEEYVFDKELLIVEITEKSKGNVDKIYQNLMELRKIGVKIMLDDFGEENSTIYDLEKYPIDGLKLDRSFVRYTETERGEVVLRSIIEAGHTMNLTVLAEGVETREQLEQFQRLNCDVIQGYYFYKPMPLRQAEKIILEEFLQKTGENI